MTNIRIQSMIMYLESRIQLEELRAKHAIGTDVNLAQYMGAKGRQFAYTLGLEAVKREDEMAPALTPQLDDMHDLHRDVAGVKGGQSTTGEEATMFYQEAARALAACIEFCRAVGQEAKERTYTDEKISLERGAHFG